MAALLTSACRPVRLQGFLCWNRLLSRCGDLMSVPHLSFQIETWANNSKKKGRKDFLFAPFVTLTWLYRALDPELDILTCIAFHIEVVICFICPQLQASILYVTLEWGKSINSPVIPWKRQIKTVFRWHCHEITDKLFFKFSLTIFKSNKSCNSWKTLTFLVQKKNHSSHQTLLEKCPPAKSERFPKYAKINRLCLQKLIHFLDYNSKR